MAHCINCEKLISDNPDYPYGDYCDEVCQREYESGANKLALDAAKAAEKVAPQIPVTRELPAVTEHTTAPDVNTFIAKFSTDGNTKG